MRDGGQGGRDPAGGLRRAFAAIRLPAALHGPLHEAQERLCAAETRIGWTLPADLHLTLIFFGDTPGDRVAALREGLEGIAVRSPPFDFQVAGAGFFGPPRAPRVVWAGVAKVPAAMSALVRNLRDFARAGGWRVEDRPFQPHITLGRVRSPAPGGALTAALRSLTNTVFGSVTAKHLSLMAAAAEAQSGARYDVIHESPLKG